ncbi:2-hydroxyacid dehydrogenase [Metabacillus sp. RGM 3146]|uniref:2-hydroxyacid dehydrogenase n=1 Tax=Metabacillus sp. RGM 3146 TaxID=3401092 RepID=UPI003B9A17C5
MDTIISYKKIPEYLHERLDKHGKVYYFNEITEENQKDFEEKLSEASALLGSSMKITEDLLNKAPNLRVVSNTSAGYDNLDLEELTRRGIIATNIAEALADTTADLIFGLMLSAARRITELDRIVRRGSWNEDIGSDRFGLDVHHKTIGIVGMGGIGRAVAKRAALGFDMKVLYTKRNRDFEAERELGVVHCELSELLSESDYVCLTIPLKKEMIHMITAKELEQMKSSAILINGSRGRVVDEEALIKALKNGEIRGAGLDVYEQEPLPKESELLSLENVVLAPHIGSATQETRNRMVEHGIDNLLAALKGEKPRNILNQSVIRA